MAVDFESLSNCAVGTIAIRRAIKSADDDLRPTPSVEELKKIAELAIAHDVYGHDAKQNRDGTWQQQGIGSWPDKVTGNHFSSLRKWEGVAAWEREVRRLWKDNPARAKAIGLPELPKA